MRLRRVALTAALVATNGLMLSIVPDAGYASAVQPPVDGGSAAVAATMGHDPAVAATMAAARTATLKREVAHIVTAQKAVSRVELRAQNAVNAALSRVASGQYVWGASSGNSFDCSGLMMYAYRQIGISLPHSSRTQSTLGKAVSIKDLRPGDLLFFYSPVHHVGMYIGDGKFVHARNPSDDLEVDSLSAYGHFTSARRIIGS
jgi:cell wall-associated NlpC family hydrolase